MKTYLSFSNYSRGGSRYIEKLNTFLFQVGWPDSKNLVYEESKTYFKITVGDFSSLCPGFTFGQSNAWEIRN